MKHILKTFLFLLGFSQLSVGFSQIIDIEQFEEIQALQEKKEAFNPKTPIAEGLDDDASRLREDVDKDVNEDVDFGYSGRKDFLVAPKLKVLGGPLKHFGYDFFKKSDTYTPINDVPIPLDYIIGPGDNIEVLLFGKKNKGHTLEVSREGIIFFPEIGPIAVSGLTFAEMKNTINAIVINQMVGTEVSLTLSKLGAINLFILGEATRPGMYTVSSLSTLTNAIFESGGINTSGSLRNIQVKRNGEVILIFDFYDLLLKGDISNDIRLMPNDVIFIPPVSKNVGINGEVERPGIYELKDTESIEEIIKFAGSLKPKADLTSIEIERISPSIDGFSLINIDLTQKLKNIDLKKGDVVKVYPVLERMRKVVLVSGHAQEPGFYPWHEGLSLRSIIKTREHLLPMTDSKYILIKRMHERDENIELIQLDLAEIFTEDPMKEEFFLEDMDEIIFFPQLLKLDLIETKFIEDDYDEGLTLQGLSYLEKSIAETEEDTKASIDGPGKTEKKYFEYSIHNYCKLPVDIINRIALAGKGLEMMITGHCRRELLDPIIAILTKQSSPSNSTSTFSVNGDVFFPGTYPLASNEPSLAKAINASGGLTKSSYLDEVEITSTEYSGKEIATPTKLVSLFSRNLVPVKSLDILTIKTLADSFNYAQIKGEVYFPGSYPFMQEETILDLIERAGGLKPAASLIDSIFQRVELAELERVRLKQLQRELRRDVLLMQNEIGEEKTMDIGAINAVLENDFEDEELEGFMGRLIIDLESMINKSRPPIILKDGDSLVIPQQSDTITVIGEVYGANAHQYDSSLTIQDYINRSGGVTEFAEVSESYIIKSDGSIVPIDNIGNGFFRSNTIALIPGDSIVVPVKLDQFSTLKATSEITKIIYEMAVAAAAISSFGN